MPATATIPQVPRSIYRPVLVQLGTAMALVGLDSRTIEAMAEAGELRWVFDVSSEDQNGTRHVRAMRFWVGELLNQSGARFKSVDQVIDAVIGTQDPLLGTYRVQNTLAVDYCTLLRLMASGALPTVREGRNWRVLRVGLDQFLRQRLQQ